MSATARWTWATVTQTSPLQILLDGDVSALTGTPIDLTGGGAVIGRRVWVQVVGGAVVIHGVAGGATWEPLATQAYATAAAAAAQSAAEDHADAYHQDTGWRDVSADRGGNFSAGTLHLRRVGRHVELRAYGLTLTSTGGSRVYYVLPAGFRASPSGVDVARPGVLSAASAAHYRTAITSVSASGADVTVYDCPAATALFGALTWITDDAWPSTLPGSAA